MTEKAPMSAGQVKYREHRDIILYLFRKAADMTYEQISNMLADYDFEISIAQIGQICSKFGGKDKLVQKARMMGMEKTEDSEIVKEEEVEFEEEIEESENSDDF